MPVFVFRYIRWSQARLNRYLLTFMLSRHGTSYLLGTFRIRFFIENRKPQTWECHVTTVLRSRLQFAVHVWTAGTASSGKWLTARFFASKNCTASRLEVRSSFLYPSVMCLLDFWTWINELSLFFGRWKCCTLTWQRETVCGFPWKT